MTTTLPKHLDDAARSSADPDGVRVVFERLQSERGVSLEAPLARRVATVAGASRSLARLVVADPDALTVLAGEQGISAELSHLREAASAAELSSRKHLAFLKVAADDLLGFSSLEEVGAELSELADAVLQVACTLAGTEGQLAVVAMGKHGARELNYASDVDVLFVSAPGVDMPSAAAAAREALAIAGGSYRIDTDLRPEGRSGALVRSLDSYEAYWESWARPWEFQALLKARAAAGDDETGHAFEAAASEAVWSLPMDAEAIAELRNMKSRAEELVARRGLADRELKRGRGGIRDIEFAVQLLQLVHGRADPALRSRSTLAALGELAGAGYVECGDAALLAIAYRFLRTVEHRLQLVEEAQVHTVPPTGSTRDHLARVLGLAPPMTGSESARPRADRFDQVLARYQSSVRSIHERLFFRPLLEAFAGDGAAHMSQAAATERLAAFGFREASRTREALTELTRGLTRSSRLMQQLLPVLLGWLAEAPDPDEGLLGLRNLAALPHQRDVVVAAFRDSPELARRLCTVLGTSRRLGELTKRHPGLALRLGDDGELQPSPRRELVERALVAADSSPEQVSTGLRRIVGAETLRIAAGELLGVTAPGTAPRQLADLGDAAVTAALKSVTPGLPFAVLAMGRLGGAELFYGSDLDLLLVYDGTGSSDAAEAERVATALFRVLNGATPSERIWTVDASLRPEGRQGPLARSIDAYSEYYGRYVEAWERQSLLRCRPLAGDSGVLERFTALAESALWDRPVTDEDVREIRRLKARTERERIPAAEDPQFHLKLGRGSLADVEWTVQLLQLEQRVASTNTWGALGALRERGALGGEEAKVLSDALSFLTATRNRWHLVGNFISGSGGPVTRVGSDSLPQSPEALSRLARSLGQRPAELRERYRRVSRRARRVVERRFYGL